MTVESITGMKKTAEKKPRSRPTDRSATASRNATGIVSTVVPTT